MLPAPDSSPETTRATLGSSPPANAATVTAAADASTTHPESGGPKGPDPTRYGDWERAGRCIDF
ncbi:MAG: DUF1674 domain-containing protein [Proteobacteria bacterium]|nr:DUF1674 domain-containing protein [Pseudomonadota bacterium]